MVVVEVVDVLTESAKEVGVVVVDTTYDGVGEDTLVGWAVEDFIVVCREWDPIVEREVEEVPGEVTLVALKEDVWDGVEETVVLFIIKVGSGTVKLQVNNVWMLPKKTLNGLPYCS